MAICKTICCREMYAWRTRHSCVSLVIGQIMDPAAFELNLSLHQQQTVLAFYVLEMGV